MGPHSGDALPSWFGPVEWVPLELLPFPARVDDVTLGEDDQWRYGFVEQSWNPDTGVWTDAIPGRTGDTGTGVSMAFEANNLRVEPPFFVNQMRPRGIVAGQMTFDFDAPPPAAADVTIAPGDTQTITLDLGATYLFVGIGGGAFTIISDAVTGELLINVEAPIEFSGPVLPSYYTPPQWTSNQNDYDPTGGGVRPWPTIIRPSTDASRNLTGVLPPDVPLGYEMEFEVQNVGTNPLVLKNASASSAAANRFSLPGAVDLRLAGGDRAVLRYDPVLTRWVLAAAANAVLDAVHGGTGLNDPGSVGYLLTSDGAGGWTSSPPPSAPPPTFTSGDHVSTSSYTVSAANTWEGTGYTMALPSSGTYLLWYSVSGKVASTSAADCLLARLRDNTAAAVIASSEQMVAVAGAGGSVAYYGSASAVLKYTASGANTLEIQVYLGKFGATASASVTVNPGPAPAGTPSVTMGYLKVS